MEPLKIVAEGRMTTTDSRVHVGGVTLAELFDHVPAKYVSPGNVDYGQARVTIELLDTKGEAA